MRRKHNNTSQDVILFLGECEILTLNSNHQIFLASRTILLRENILLTYINPLSAVKDPKLSAFSRSKNPPIPLEKLINHECQYKITPTMRARLLIGRNDPGVDSYLRELKIQTSQKERNIVAIINSEENFINGFVFSRQNVALEFYESLNTAIITQMYMQSLPETLAFNFRIANMLAETVNGRCVVNPDDFAESKQEEDQLNFVLDFLRKMSTEPLINFKGLLCEIRLRFRIIDDMSKDYASRFLSCFPDKIERLSLSECQLTSNMVGQILSGYPSSNLCDRLKLLQELNLSKNHLNDDVFTTITKLLKSSYKIQTLDLNHNNVTFQKQSILASFLSSVTNIRLALLLSHNSIYNSKHIIKYLVNAEGSLPLSELDISFNPFIPQDLANLTRAYLMRLKQSPSYDFKLHLNQLEFQEPHAFEFLQEEYRFKKPTTMSIPMSISKHVIKKKGKELGSSQEELKKSARIEELFKNYGVEVFRGNFFKIRQIKLELKGLGVDEETLLAETQRYEQYKQQQQQMIIRKMQKCLNFQVQPSNIIAQMNETLRFCRRKGLTGAAFDVFAIIKSKIEGILAKTEAEQDLGFVFRQYLFEKKGRFKAFYQDIEGSTGVNYANILKMSEKELRKEYLMSDQTDNISVFLSYHYLLMDKPEKYHPFMIESWLTDPRLISARIARFDIDNIIQIFEKNRVEKSFLSINQQKMAFISLYGIETYRFSHSFIESGISSSAYTGMLSCSKIQPQQEKIILAFIQISKNFMKYLYHTPNEISQQTIIYLNSIVAHLTSLQNEADNDLKTVLSEELFIHLMTFFDFTRYQPLQKGFLVAICEFIARRVSLQEELLKRIAAFLMKNELLSETEFNLHHSHSKEQWEGKVDWKIVDMESFRSMLLKRGKIEVKIADIAHPQLLITIELDEIDTVRDLWDLVKKNLNKLNEFTNLSEANIDYYWLCGIKSGTAHGYLKFLPSYEHIGKLLFDQKYENKFYLKRVIYRPEEHSFDHLAKIRYDQLIGIYQQSKENIKSTASVLLPKETVLQAIKSTIWIDILLIEELMLGNLRRQSDEESTVRYNQEREKIVNESIAKLYNKYMPLNFSLDQASRNNIIFDIKGKQMSGVPKNINDTIKESILTLIKKVGITAFTTVLHDSQDKSSLLINSHDIIFMDKSQSQPKLVRTSFRNVMWFELAVEADMPVLKFEIVQQANCKSMSIRKVSIQGDSLWITQCFALLSQTAKNRLSYPAELLFLNEDSGLGLSPYLLKSEVKSLLTLPLLDIDRYFAFTLSRRVEVALPVAASTLEKQVQAQAPPLSKKDSKRESRSIQPPSQLKQFLQERASRQLPNNIEIQQIVRAIQQPQPDEQHVITSRRSSNANGKKDVNRRRSRNR